MDYLLLQTLREKLQGPPGINGKTELFNSAVLALLICIDGVYHFVFEKRSQHIRHAGEICFPGGRYDPLKDMDFKQTALRETAEELGVEPNKIDVIGALDTVISPVGTTVDVFLGVLETDCIDVFHINQDEVSELLMIPVTFFENTEPLVYYTHIVINPFYINEKGEKIVTFPAEELGLPEKYKTSWGGAKNPTYVYKTDHGVIWGMTARIIKDVVNRIHEATSK